jgi:hypothetical protein
MNRAGVWAIALLAMLLSAPVNAGTVRYFLVAERPGSKVHGDSFVLPMTDDEAIVHARDLIKFGPDIGLPIVFATIAPGANDINRNLTVTGQPKWNWHVTGFDGFGDMGIELIDSWPTYIENNLSNWMKETGGRIGFWNYTIVKELPGYPDVRPPVPVPLPLAFASAIVALPMLFIGRKWLGRSAD